MDKEIMPKKEWSIELLAFRRYSQVSVHKLITDIETLHPWKWDAVFASQTDIGCGQLIG